MLEDLLNSTNGQSSSSNEALPKQGATVPEEIYAQLPEFLRDACSVFEEATERDIFLLGALGVLSGCLPNYIGVYDRKKIGPNLFIFILASASAGKSSLTWARLLGQSIHKKLRDDDSEEKQRMLFIPTNSSSAAFLNVLGDNEGRGILFSSEADTLSNSLAQDWGNFSDVLRKCFHHEHVSLLRKKDRQYIEIERPGLSLVLSGTPAQVRTLIKDAENGLFSRVAFYRVYLEPKMKDVFGEAGEDLEEHFNELGVQVARLYENLSTRWPEIEFALSADQQQRFLDTYREWHKSDFLAHGELFIATVRRLGVIHFRIAMTLNMLRHIEAEDLPDKIICTDEDFDTAYGIVQVLKKHAADLFAQLARHAVKDGLDPRKQRLYDCLEEEFDRRDAVDIAEEIDLSPATLDRFLKSDYFERTKYGRYRKTK